MPQQRVVPPRLNETFQPHQFTFRGSHMRKLLLALAAGLMACSSAYAQTEPAKKATSDAIQLPTPAEVKEMQAYPKEFQLIGEDDARQIVLTGVLQNGAYQDLTGDVQYEVADNKILRVTS